MAVGDLLRVSVEATLHGQTTFNTFYYLQTAGAGVEDELQSNNLCNAILAAPWWAAYIDLHSEEWVFTKFRTVKVVQAGAIIGDTISFETDALNNAGDFVGESLPSSVALVVRRRTAIGGRRGMGRIYLCGVPAAWELDSKINTEDPNFGPAMGDFLANVNNVVTQGTLSWEPRHYMPSGPAIVHAAIRQWVFDEVLRNQRRRQWGRGM